MPIITPLLDSVPAGEAARGQSRHGLSARGQSYRGRPARGRSGPVGNWPDPLRALRGVGNWPDPL